MVSFPHALYDAERSLFRVLCGSSELLFTEYHSLQAAREIPNHVSQAHSCRSEFGSHYKPSSLPVHDPRQWLLNCQPNPKSKEFLSL